MFDNREARLAAERRDVADLSAEEIESYTVFRLNGQSHPDALQSAREDTPRCPDVCPTCGMDLKSDGYPIGHQTDEGDVCAFRWVRLA